MSQAGYCKPAVPNLSGSADWWQQWGRGRGDGFTRTYAPLSQLQVCKRMPTTSMAQFPMGCSLTLGWGTGVWEPLLQANLILWFSSESIIWKCILFWLNRNLFWLLLEDFQGISGYIPCRKGIEEENCGKPFL